MSFKFEAESFGAFKAVVKMVSLNLIAAILASNVLCVVSSDPKGIASDCSKTKRSFHEFNDKLLLGEENVSFARSKDQIVIVTNVATF